MAGGLWQTPPIRVAVVTAVGAAGLTVPALRNGFPLIFPDSMDYIVLTPRLYRSPFYQLFVFLTGFKQSIWVPVLVQALVAAWVLAIFLAVEVRASLLGSLMGMALLCLLSSLPVFASFVMPDLFTGVMFVALYLLVFRWRDLSRWQRAALALVALVAATVHLSHLTMAFATLVAGTLLLYARDGRRAPVAGIVASLAVCLTSAGAVLAYNLAVFGLFSLSPAGSTFFLANLLATGPAREELAQLCPDPRYRLCAYRDRLPADANAILWEDGMVKQLGGFEALRGESDRLVGETLRDRPAEVIVFAVGNTVHAVPAINSADDIVPHRSLAGAVIAQVYGDGTRQRFAQGLQMRGTFPQATYNRMTWLGLLLALPALVLGIVRLGWRRSSFAIFAILAFLGNAAFCATLSGVHDRYQSRVSWLLPLAALALLSEVSRSSRAPGGGRQLRPAATRPEGV